MTETAAEEALAALARDLAGEIGAAQAVELAGPEAMEQLELAVFNVKPFSRTQRVGKSGKVVREQVRTYPEQRLPGSGLEHPGDLGGEHFVLGDPSHMIHSTSEPEWVANEWKAHQVALSHWQKAEPKPSAGRKPKTPEEISDEVQNRTFDKLPASDNYKLARQRLDEATDHLLRRDQGTQAGRPDQDHAAKSYHSLTQAHEHIRAQVLPHAKPEEYPEIAEHLQRISGHMQDLDRAMGAKPETTRKLLGTYRENFAHAGEARRTGEAIALAAQAREAAIGGQPVLPEPKKGASAVHPHLGSRHVTAFPGDTMSGTAHRHVPRPFDVPPPNPDQGRALQAEAAAQRASEELEHQRTMQGAVREEQQANAVRERVGIPPAGTYQKLSDEQFVLHQKQVDDAVERAFSEGKATDEQFTANGDGYTWDPDRASLHADIVRDYLDRQVNVPSQHHVLLLAGLPGSGKSTMLKAKGVDLKDYAVVSADDFKEELARRGMVPELKGLSPMESSTLVHQESRHLVNLVLAELERRGKNIALEVTLSKEGQSRQMLSHFEDKGYSVTALLADVPAKTAADRVARRYRSELEGYRKGTNPLGGRYIPRYDLLKAEAAPGVTYPSRTFDKLKNQFGYWERWDGAQSPPVLKEKASVPEVPAEGAIPSVEELRRQVAPRGRVAQPFTGATEAQARAREKGTA